MQDICYRIGNNEVLHTIIWHQKRLPQGSMVKGKPYNTDSLMDNIKMVSNLLLNVRYLNGKCYIV